MPRYHLRQRPLYRQADEAPAGAFHGGCKAIHEETGRIPLTHGPCSGSFGPDDAGFDWYLFCICSAMFWYHWWLRCMEIRGCIVHSWKSWYDQQYWGIYPMITNCGSCTGWWRLPSNWRAPTLRIGLRRRLYGQTLSMLRLSVGLNYLVGKSSTDAPFGYILHARRCVYVIQIDLDVDHSSGKWSIFVQQYVIIYYASYIITAHSWIKSQ